MQCTIYYPSFLTQFHTAIVRPELRGWNCTLQFQVAEGKPPEEGGLVEAAEAIWFTLVTQPPASVTRPPEPPVSGHVGQVGN